MVMHDPERLRNAGRSRWLCERPEGPWPELEFAGDQECSKCRFVLEALLHIEGDSKYRVTWIHRESGQRQPMSYREALERTGS